MNEFINDIIRDMCIWFWFLTWKQKFYLFIILSCMACVARVIVYIFWS